MDGRFVRILPVHGWRGEWREPISLKKPLFLALRIELLR